MKVLVDSRKIDRRDLVSASHVPNAVDTDSVRLSVWQELVEPVLEWDNSHAPVRLAEDVGDVNMNWILADQAYAFCRLDVIAEARISGEVYEVKCFSQGELDHFVH